MPSWGVLNVIVEDETRLLVEAEDRVARCDRIENLVLVGARQTILIILVWAYLIRVGISHLLFFSLNFSVKIN